MLEQELDAYWKTVVDTIQDGLMVLDEDGTIISVNKALETITRYSQKELIGKPCTVLQCDICQIARGKRERTSEIHCGYRDRDSVCDCFLQGVKQALCARCAPEVSVLYFARTK